MKQTYKTNSYTYNSFSSSGNINLDYDEESQTNADSKMKFNNDNDENQSTEEIITEQTDPKEEDEQTDRIDRIDVDQFYMDDGAAVDEKSTSTEDFHDDEADDKSKETINLGMLRSRPFIPDDDDDDDDDDKSNDRIEHSGAGIDKYGDYENDNVQNRDRSESLYKHSKSSFGAYDGLDKASKIHENSDFERHPFQSKTDSKDAIKIISTPLGKVSIIYQSNANNNKTHSNTAATNSNLNNDSKLKTFDNSNQNSMNKFKNFYSHNVNTGAKQNNTNQHRMIKNREHHRHNHHHHQQQQQQPSLPATSNTDSSLKDRTNQMNDKTKLLQKQITPVLTADGKVALLYRGAQDTNGQQKIEVSSNLTDFIHSVNSQESSGITGKMNYNIVSESKQAGLSGEIATNQTENITAKTLEKLAIIVAAETTTTTTRTKLTTFAPVVNTERPVLRLFKSDENTSQNTNEEENSILPNINRPPSEVLGIKKNQFTQFRITDLTATATPTLNNQEVTEKTPSSYANEVPKIIDTLENTNKHETHGHDVFGQNLDYDYNSNRDSNFNNVPNHLATPAFDFTHNGAGDSTTISDVLSKAEVVNLAIIPAFEGDLHRFHEQQQNDVSDDNNPYYNMLDRDENGGETVAGKQHKHRHHKIKDLSALHCAMQALVAIAALATVFGMLGAYFKQRILDQLTIMHW